MSILPKGIRDRLRNKDYRDAYIAEGVRNWVAIQIRRLRESRGMSQQEFGALLKKPQSVVSRLEDPDYGKPSVSTLLDVAAALDIALLVQFVGHDEFLARTADMSASAMYVEAYRDPAFAIVSSAPPASTNTRLAIRGAANPAWQPSTSVQYRAA